MPHVTTVTVRGYHCDFYGHVNNARYLEFLEEARWQYLQAGLDLRRWQERGLGFVVVSLTIDYRRPAGPGTVLEIRSHLKKVGGRSAVIRQDVRDGADGAAVALADVTFAVIDLQSGKAVPLAGEVLQTLLTCLGPADENPA